MNCPYCNAEMMAGSACISMSTSGCLLALLTGGVSRSDLWFASRDGSKDTIIPSGMSLPALRCPQCNTVIIRDEE
jgi:hypothetical protein